MRTPQAGFTDTPGEGRMDESLTHSRRGKKNQCAKPPKQGNQAVNPTPRGRRPPPYSGGRVWSIVPYVCRRAREIETRGSNPALNTLGPFRGWG